MEDEIFGFWRIVSIDMIAGHAVHLIGGNPGEFAEFTSQGTYLFGARRQFAQGRKPALHCRFETKFSQEISQLDIWIPSLKALVCRCVYRVEQNRLTICVAGDHGERPTEIRRDDERLWCVITMKKAKLPQSRKQSPK